MNSSKSRVIALLLVIPLLLIFVMTSVVETTQIVVDIPVSSVKILGDKVVDIDIATQSNMYQIETELTPKNATNQNVKLECVEQVPGQQNANVKITDDGKVIALSLGSAIITATAGNGRQDKIQLNFTMGAVSDVAPVTMQVPINVGESIDLTDGEYLAKRGTIRQATWTSANSAIASVNDLGVVKGQSVGNTTVDGAIVGKHLNSQTGEVTDKVYNVNYQVNVTSVADEQTGIAFTNSPVDPNGLHIKPGGPLNKATFNFTVTPEKLQQYGALTTFVSADDSQGVQSAKLTQQADGTFQLDVELAQTAKEGVKYAVEIHSKPTQNLSLRSANGQNNQGEYITTVYVQKGYYTYIQLQQNRKAIKVKDTDQNMIALDHDIVQGAVNLNSIVYKTSNPQVLTVLNNGERCSIKTTGNEGTAYVWAEMDILGTIVKTNEVEISVVDPAKSISFSENTESLGLENIKTIAGNVVEFSTGFVNGDANTWHFYKNPANCTIVPTNYTLGVSALKYSNNQAVNSKDIIWRSSDQSIATVKDGVVTAVGDGEVTITAYSAYNEALGLKGDDAIQASVTLRCVKDAIWVDDYYDLMFAMERTVDGKSASLPVVLRSDVMLAPVLGDTTFADYVNYMENYATSQMQTTMDATYYKDGNIFDKAQIRYCVNVTNNIYGNGRSICGEYITNSKRLTGYEVFRGPLELVKVTSTTGDNVGESAAVKAQDNVVFMVNTPNVTICNVELKGCADQTLYGWNVKEDGVTLADDAVANLSNFDHVGTVLEVVEDGCNLAYSRVNNGRTVVRIFGKAYDTELESHKRTTDEQQQYIKDNIESLRTQTIINNCILEYGREFVLKLSSNQIIKNQNTIDKTYDFETLDIMDVAGPMLSASYLGKYTTQATNKDGTKVDCIQSGIYRGETAHSQYTADVEDFYNNYVLTDVILRDSVFSNSGLFCVGFESRFAGPLLFGQDILNFGLPKQGWANVAGTSMPARLKMEGDVRFYDWKVLENVNSETLIEVSENFGDLGKYLSLDIPGMVESYQTEELKRPNTTFVNLLTEKNDQLYINGATAFYGGGKNYSYIDVSGVNGNFVSLDCYTVPMSYLPHPTFTSAAGEEPFRFFLYNSQSSLGIREQDQQLSDNTAYDWLYRK